MSKKESESIRRDSYAGGEKVRSAEGLLLWHESLLIGYGQVVLKSEEEVS